MLTLLFGNLETTFAGESKKYSGYPTFNSPDALGYALKDIGVDVLSTANNHSLDKGESGLIRTLDTLDGIGISHTGTYKNYDEQNSILVKDVNGIKIAFLSFTYGTNGINVPNGKDYLINLTNDDAILKQVTLAKNMNVDLICACMHWGIEYVQKQNAEQERLANLLFENGVDIIIGNHPHVVEPMQKKEITLADGSKKDVFVAYALGNFVSGQNKEHTKSTAILNLKITKNGKTGKISIDSVDYIPVYCLDRGAGSSNRYELFDMKASIQDYENGNSANISSGLYNILKNELANVEFVLGSSI